MLFPNSRPYSRDTNGNAVVRVVQATEAVPFTDFDFTAEQFTFNTPVGTVIGEFVFVDGNAPLTFKLLENPNDYFAVNGQTLVKNNELIPLGFYTFKVEATDNAGFTVIKEFTIESVESAFINTRSLLFNGVDEYVDIGNNDTVNNVSIFCWIKTSVAGQVNIASKFGPGNFAIRFLVSSNKFRVFLYSTAGSSPRKDYIASPIINDGAWHFVGFTFSNDELRLYVDGVEPSGSRLADDSFNEIFAATNSMLIGSQENGSANYPGNIDEFAIYGDTVLTPTEVAELYNNGEPIDLKAHPSVTRLKHWYRMGDDFNNGFVPDQQGNLNGIAVNMTASNLSTDTPE